MVAQREKASSGLPPNSAANSASPSRWRSATLEISCGNWKARESWFETARTRLRKAVLCFEVFRELVRYDLLFRVRGFEGVRKAMRGAAEGRRQGGEDIAAVCRAVACVSSFYWKPLLCLQRSVVTARVLRAKGIHADVVIGFRAVPFLSHAWVEAGGRVVDDSQLCRQKLNILDRF